MGIQLGAGDGVTKSQSIPIEKESNMKTEAQSEGLGRRVSWKFCGVVVELEKKIRAVGGCVGERGR